MFYFKQFDIDERISNEIKDWGVNNLQSSNVPFVKLDVNDFKKQCPLFMQWADQKQLKIILAVGIKVTADYKQPEVAIPHVDLMDDSRSIALNFPISGCEGTCTKMYNLIKGEQINIDLPDGTTYSKFSDDSEFEEVAKFYLTKPTFFNTSVPHQLFGVEKQDRLALSLRFESNPVLD